MYLLFPLIWILSCSVLLEISTNSCKFCSCSRFRSTWKQNIYWIGSTYCTYCDSHTAFYLSGRALCSTSVSLELEGVWTAQTLGLCFGVCYEFNCNFTFISRKQTDGNLRLLSKASGFCSQVFDFSLTAEEMSYIGNLNKNWRYIVPMITVNLLCI